MDDRLNETALREVLPEGLILGGNLVCLDSVDSTNTYLKRLIPEGVPHGTAVLANGQTEGRGRRERRFESPPGAGIYLSVLLRLNCPPERIAGLTAWAAAAVCGALERCCGVRPDIKWVNDLLLNGRKVCGILTELVVDGGKPCAVLGVGLNVTQSREELDGLGLGETATSLAAEGVRRGRLALAAALIAALDKMAAEFPMAWERWLACYRTRCVTVGRQVLVTGHGLPRPALALAVEEDFSLRVRYEDGTEERVFSGEVSIRMLKEELV